MHVYFIGIGGSGLSSLAHLAIDAGLQVSGSDLQKNSNVEALLERGIFFNAEQDSLKLVDLHAQSPIDWVVYSSSVALDHPELLAATYNAIKITKREDFINYILEKSNQKLIAVAGTHGKTTTSAMISWLFYSLKLPVSHIIGSTPAWAHGGQYDSKSDYLILEADEYDRHFLNYSPYLSLVTSYDYDHPDIYSTADDYAQAFKQFLGQSEHIFGFGDDLKKILQESYLNFPIQASLPRKLAGKISDFKTIRLPGVYNRHNAALALRVIEFLFPKLDLKHLNDHVANFPGTERRMQRIIKNLYTDYAHHPAEIEATLDLAAELKEKVVAVYQPHQNTRQHEVYKEYSKVFLKAEKVLWLPTYLTRENPDLKVLTPQELIKNLVNAENAEVVEFSQSLKNKIQAYLDAGYLVVCMGAGSIDTWLRSEFGSTH